MAPSNANDADPLSGGRAGALVAESHDERERAGDALASVTCNPDELLARTRHFYDNSSGPLYPPKTRVKLCLWTDSLFVSTAAFSFQFSAR